MHKHYLTLRCAGQFSFHFHTVSTNNSRTLLCRHSDVWLCCCATELQITHSWWDPLVPSLSASFPASFLCYFFSGLQGQLAAWDRVPLYPCGSPEINKGISSGQRARSCDLLADSLAALQADVCLRSGEAHLPLSHVVGPHRYKCESHETLQVLPDFIGKSVWWVMFLVSVFNSSDISLWNSVHPYSTGLVCPPVAGLVAEAQRSGNIRYRNPCTVSLLQSFATAATCCLLYAGEKRSEMRFLNAF